MHIEKIWIGDHHVSLANDQDNESEPPCWKTKIGVLAWSVGFPTREEAIEDARKELQLTCGQCL